MSLIHVEYSTMIPASAERVLLERDLEAGLTTVMWVAPANDGKQSRVTIETEFTASPGWEGLGRSG